MHFDYILFKQKHFVTVFALKLRLIFMLSILNAIRVGSHQDISMVKHPPHKNQGTENVYVFGIAGVVTVMLI